MGKLSVNITKLDFARTDTTANTIMFMKYAKKMAALEELATKDTQKNVDGSELIDTVHTIQNVPKNIQKSQNNHIKMKKLKLVLEVMTKHEHTINLVVEEILSIKSKIMRDELESTVRILSQEIRLLQVENKSMIYRLSQLEEEPEAKDESEEESDDDDSSEDDFEIKQALSHKNKQAVPFKCNMCDYKSENAITLSKHKNTKHNMTNTNESALMKDNDKIEQSNEHSNKKVRIADKSLVLTLPRVDLDEGELEDVKSHAKESGMNLDEFLLEMPKILEGYLRLNKDM